MMFDLQVAWMATGDVNSTVTKTGGKMEIVIPILPGSDGKLPSKCSVYPLCVSVGDEEPRKQTKKQQKMDPFAADCCTKMCVFTMRALVPPPHFHLSRALTCLIMS